MEELQKFDQNLSWIENELSKKHRELNLREDKAIKAEIYQQITELEKKKKQMEWQFLASISSQEMPEFQDIKDDKKKSLPEEFQELLSPVIESLKRVTQRPRKIEKLHTLIQENKDAIHFFKFALKQMSEYEKGLQSGAVDRDKTKLNRLTSLQEKISNRLKQHQLDLEGYESEFKRIAGDRRSFIDVMTNVFNSFFRKKGKNFLIGLLISSLACWILMSMRGYLISIMLKSKRLENFSKVLNLLYGTMVGGISVISFVVCLFMLNDWVLFTMAIVIVMGGLWSLKHLVPRFIEEVRLILNLGTVRENEIIRWKGILWRVEKLNFYSTLSNDRLEGGKVRVAARDLTTLTSRQSVDGEDLFPCEKGDWLLYESFELVQVSSLTPDQIFLRKIGNSLYCMSTQEFLNKKIENLSKGFRIEIICGLDYTCQKVMANELLLNFEKKFKERFFESNEFDKSKIFKIEVNFHSAGPSSLNYWVAISCEGVIAQYYEKIRYWGQRSFIEVANDLKLEIPFTQVTLSFKEGQRPVIKDQVSYP